MRYCKFPPLRPSLELPIIAGKPALSGAFRPEMTTNDDIFALISKVNAEKSMACAVLGVNK